jgi:hypothetical protein
MQDVGNLTRTYLPTKNGEIRAFYLSSSKETNGDLKPVGLNHNYWKRSLTDTN